MQKDTKGYLITWISSLVVFFINLYFGTIYNGPFNEDEIFLKIFLFLLVGSFSVGVGSFMFLLANSMKAFFSWTKKKKKFLNNFLEKKTKGSAMLVSIIVLMVLFTGFIYSKNKEMDRKYDKQKYSVSSPTPTKKNTPIPSKKTAETSKEYSTLNNQIDCTGPDGIVFKMTQEKCDEFNNAWNNKQESGAEKSSRLISCQLSYGTYSITVEQCNYAKQLDTGSNTIKLFNYVTPYNNYVVIGNTNSESSVNNAELLDKCRSEIQSVYQSERTTILNSARALGINPSRAIDQLKEDLERAVQSCEDRYPLN